MMAPHKDKLHHAITFLRHSHCVTGINITNTLTIVRVFKTVGSSPFCAHIHSGMNIRPDQVRIKGAPAMKGTSFCGGGGAK